MAVLTGPGLVVASLLVVAGAQKVVDPAMTVGALRALRWPSNPWLVRLGATGELLLGAAVIAVGGTVLWLAVMVSYLAFAAFVSAALRKGTMIGSCGCFGREDTPPHPSHVLLNAVLATVAAGAAASGQGSLVESVAAGRGQGVAVVVLAAVSLYLLHALYVELPRTLAAARAVRRPVA